jgi:RimJ/RimL family protein N-acetyltransferase
MRTPEIKRIFVFCGGSDPQNLTQQVIDEISFSELSNIAVDVVVGAQNKTFDRQAAIKLNANIEIHDAGGEFARIMSRADLAIGAGGTTSWERMCLGIPSIVVSIAENQNSACEKLGRDGLVNYLGTQSSLKPGAIKDAVIKAKNKFASFFDQIERGQILVDGRGCKRVAEFMCPSNESDLVVRLARPEDCVEFFNWANDPAVREQSLSTSTIQWPDHKKWFAEKISSNSCEVYVMAASGLPVGQVRFEKSATVAETNYSLDKIVRNRRWASAMLEMAMKRYLEREAVSLKAIVKSENHKSRPIFFKLGFREDLTTNPPPSAFYSFAFASDRGSWFNSYLRELKFDLLMLGHSVSHVHEEKDLSSADFCFYLSFSRVVSKVTLDLFRHNFVVHSSDLPEGRGWSPLTWQILEGKNEIPTVLFEASEKVDSGQIYSKQELKFEGHELINEIREAQGTLIVSMVKSLIEDYPRSLFNGIQQSGKGSYYPRRRSVDSKVDPESSLRQVFLQLRVADNDNYPAFFELNGHKYELRISKR